MSFDQCQTVRVELDGQSIEIAYRDSGSGELAYVLMHGWGVDGGFMLPLAQRLQALGRLIVIDFPGFGASSMSATPWDTRDYANCIKQALNEIGIASPILIGHSFGGRVAVRLASESPEKYKAVVLIASAGLKRKSVSSLKKIRIRIIQTIARLAKRLIPGKTGEQIKQRLYQSIASRDYLNAGPLRKTFVKVVNEDLEPLLPLITAPVLLLWGSDDEETPPEFGQRMNQILTQSQYVELPGFDHYSILNRGSHQTAHLIKQFIKDLP